MKNTPIPLSADELRLVRLYRCADPFQQNEILINLGQTLWKQHLGEKSVSSFMPHGGVGPNVEEIDDPNSAAYVIYQGLLAIGEDDLFATCDSDEQDKAKAFARSADSAAMNQGSLFNYNEKFAIEYLRAWREHLIEVIEHHTKMDKEDKQDD